MVDKVKPLKIEDATSGTEVNPFPTEADPSEDYLSGKGLALENLDTHLIDRDGNDIQFTDPTAGTRTVNELRTATQNSFDGSGATPAFVATDVNQGVIEARDYALANATGTAAGFGINFGKSGNVKNKWMDYFSSITSDVSTFIAAEAVTITALSAALSEAGTGEIEIYVDGVLTDTIDFVAVDQVSMGGLNIAVAAGQAVSAKVSNTGTLKNPTATVFLEVA